jgi:hypothetical protein
MFQEISGLTFELDGIVKDAKEVGDPELFNRVTTFVIRVAELVQLAFDDVHKRLRELAYLKPSEVTPDRVMELRSHLAATYDRDKFKNVLDICRRLHLLAEEFDEDLASKLGRKDASGYPDPLMQILGQHEGYFIRSIENALNELDWKLNDYDQTQSVEEARNYARMAMKELRRHLESVQQFHLQVLKSLPGGNRRILDPTERKADAVLRRSPWHKGLFYLSVFVVVAATFTIVAGNVNPWTLPLILTAILVGMVLVGTFQLRADEQLKEERFLRIVDLALRRVFLPVMAKRNYRSGEPSENLGEE